MTDTKQPEALQKFRAIDFINTEEELESYVAARLLGLQRGYDAAVDALKDMAAEFRALDLPYGSKAYAKATAVIYGHPQVAAPAAVAGPSEILEKINSLISSINEAHRSQNSGWRQGCFDAADNTYKQIKDMLYAAPTTQAAPQPAVQPEPVAGVILDPDLGPALVQRGSEDSHITKFGGKRLYTEAPVAQGDAPGWIRHGHTFGGKPRLALEIDPSDFYGITDAIHHALEQLDEHEDPDTSPLDPKRSRRLRQALMAAWLREYPQEAAHAAKKGQSHD